MSHLNVQRNTRVRNHRSSLKVNDPVRFESMKEKEKNRGRQRRLAKKM